MPLPLPRLDTYTFDQLLEEGLALLPRLAPGWTDYNLHDPGITLVELLAWLVEIDIYRLDRTSREELRSFLALVGIHPRPPIPARAALVFHNQDAGVPLRLPAPVCVSDPASKRTFQAEGDVTVFPASLRSVLVIREDDLWDMTALNREDGFGYSPLGSSPEAGTALYLGFDAPFAAAGEVSRLYCWSMSPEQGLACGWMNQSPVREDEDNQEASFNAGFPRDGDEHYSARLSWEYFTGSEMWRPLQQVEDLTRGLTMSGEVRFTVLPGLPPAAGGLAARPGEYFLRCRMLRGYYECPPRVRMLALNTLPFVNAVQTAAAETQLEGNGCAGQSFRLKSTPVLAHSVQLHMQPEGGEDETWREAPGWQQVRPFERSFLLDPESGVITFGDGLHGRVPPQGAAITVHSYRVGGGAAGNLPAGRLESWPGEVSVSVRQPFPAVGGADAETLEAARARAVQWLEKPARAASLADIETLALQTPGVPVLRARALADYDPALPGVPALGSVTLVLLPECANPLPEAGPDMLCAVQAYLESRRTLTAELHVIPAGFVTIGVQAQISPAPGAGGASLPGLASARLDAFLDPLHGGPDGQGWEFGRAVYESEIMAVLNDLPGVDHVDRVRIEVQARVQLYRGNLTWMQIFSRGGGSVRLDAWLRITADQPAARVVPAAGKMLDAYFHSAGGSAPGLTAEACRENVLGILEKVPNVLGVEQLDVALGAAAPASCGTVTLCANEVVVPGRHSLALDSQQEDDLIAGPPC